MEKPKMLSLSSLKDRGWTQAMISSVLGEPDDTRKNPRYAKAAPMKLYAEDRVSAAELSPLFTDAKAKSSIRSAAAKRVCEAKRESLLLQVRDMQVSVQDLSADRVRFLAIKAYNDWNSDAVSLDEDAKFLDRITVNFIRHNLTEYDEVLEQVAGRVGVNDAVKEIQRKIYQAIAMRYPFLEEECRRQMARKEALAEELKAE
jgi:hypothetical protein